MSSPSIHTIDGPTNDSVKILLQFTHWFSRHEGALNDRCLTLEIHWDPRLNGIRTNQCNHAGILGNGDKGTQHVCLPAWLPDLLARPVHQVYFCMEWQTAEWPRKCCSASRSPQIYHKEPRQNLTMVECEECPMPRLAGWGGDAATGFKCSLSSPSNAPCHFLLGQACPGGLNWKSSP